MKRHALFMPSEENTEKFAPIIGLNMVLQMQKGTNHIYLSF